MACKVILVFGFGSFNFRLRKIWDIKLAGVLQAVLKMLRYVSLGLLNKVDGKVWGGMIEARIVRKDTYLERRNLFSNFC